MTYEVDLIFGCHIAHGRRDKDGYVLIGQRRAHLLAWEAVHGPVPDGLVLDHWCSRRACCAVHHLEAVTQSVNLYRRAWRNRARLAHCPKGHPMNVNAVVVPGGGRVCRTCNREAAP